MCIDDYPQKYIYLHTDIHVLMGININHQNEKYIHHKHIAKQDSAGNYEAQGTLLSTPPECAKPAASCVMTVPAGKVA